MPKDLDQLLFRTLQNITLARLINEGKTCFSLGDYYKAWNRDSSLKDHVQLDIKPSDEVLRNQLMSCDYVGYIVGKQNSGFWYIRDAAIDYLVRHFGDK